MSNHKNDLYIEYGVSPKTLTSNITGFIVCIIFTLVAFYLVWKRETIGITTVFAGLGILAVLQLYAQVVFFLRINASKKGAWNLWPFLFTILVVLVVLCGSLWIMINLNYNMMN